MNKRILIISCLTLLAVSCSEKTTEVVTEVAEVTMPTIELKQGKSIYENKCHRCHKLKTIDNYSAVQWANILPDMSKKAKLPAADEALVKSYVAWELAN